VARAPRPEPPLARVASHAPGRVRLRLAAHRGDAAFFSAVSAAALMLPGVTAAAANPETAGLLLRFRGDLATVLNAAAREGLFTVAAPSRAPESRAARAEGLGGLLLGGLALVQMTRGVILPPALTLLWYAGSLLRGDAGHGET
jgi:hypothetical protein